MTISYWGAKKWILLLLIVAGTLSGVAIGQGTSPQIPLDQSGRYMAIATEGYALLVDTRSGCVWAATATKMNIPIGVGYAIKQFVLKSVEGLVEVSTSPNETANVAKAIPMRCIQ